MALSDLANALFWLGIVVAFIGGVAAIGLGRARGWIEATKYGGGTLAVGGVLLVSGWLITTFAIGPAAVAPPPAGGAVATTLAGGSLAQAAALTQGGVTWNAATGVVTVDLVYNYSSGANYFCVRGANVTCGPTASLSQAPNYVDLPFTMARTDASNNTYGFSAAVNSVPVYTTVGGSTTTYSFVGYKAASGTSLGQWQVKWSAGSLAGQFPTGAAPATTTSLISTLVGINGFKSQTTALQISLPGGNSTSAPLSGSTPVLFGSTTIQQFVAYPMTISFQNSVPSSVTINFIVVGQHA